MTIYGNKVYTAKSNFQPETSERMLGMGTKLELVEPEKLKELIGNRAAYYNYAIYLPVRSADGSYKKIPALLSKTAAVCKGYLPLNYENISKVALSTLGEAYGWGGMMNTEDCSGMVRKIYSCFGIDIARNGNWQWEMPIAKISLKYLSVPEKQAILDQLPLGTALCFPGHEMMYLGKSNGKYYVISNVSRMVVPGDAKAKRIRSSVINTLDVLRNNGHTWLEELTTAMMPAYGLIGSKSYDFPKNTWYYDGMSYCLDKKYMTQNEAGDFAGLQAASRSDGVTALWNIANRPTASCELSFSDVAGDSLCYEAIRWAAVEGISNGTSQNLFSPNMPLSRQQLCVLLWRYFKPEKTASDEYAFASYKDADKVADYAKEAVSWAVSEGIIKGTSEGMLSPDGICSRAELAVSLMRIFQ